MRRPRTSRAHVAILAAAVASSLGTTAAPALASPSAKNGEGVDNRLLVVKFKPRTPRPVADRTLRRAHVTRAGAIRRLSIVIVRVQPRHPVAQSLAVLRSAPVVAYAARGVPSEPPQPEAPQPAAPETAAAPAAPVAPKVPVPNDPDWAEQWSLSKLGLPAAWAAAPQSPVVVATVDGGADGGQPDLAGAFVAGYDFVNQDDDPADDFGHGTSVAGVIGARTNNATGVAGICPRCVIMPVKVSDAQGKALMSNVAAGIVWATDHGARVINVSIGGPPQDDVAKAVRFAHDRGAVVVAAAGNGGSPDKLYPAAYPEVISVAGTDDSDRLYSWSTRGPWVRIAAPGCNVSTMLNGSYGMFCGSSSAAPVVAGVAGLALSVAPGASGADVERALLATRARVAGANLMRVDAAATVDAILRR